MHNSAIGLVSTLLALMILASCSARDQRPQHPPRLGSGVGADDVAVWVPTDTVACDAAEVLLLDSEEQVVAGRVHVIPLPDARIAIRAIGYGRSGSKAVNEFVLKQSGEVEAMPEALRPVVDRAVQAPLRCKLHGEALIERRETMVPTDRATPDGYPEAEKKLFPNACPPEVPVVAWPDGSKSPALSGTLLSLYCPKCRAAREAWLEQHPAAGE
ncbi:MAG: hypothetical protein JXQ29_08340 [Planctomycetes bacterium]|nr:hypothetical protein [Planctomycetota bacterium]